MAKMNAPKDHMFRAGQISSKEWGRLSMTANGKGGKMPSKMAKFEHKKKDEGDRQNKAIASTKPGHIDGPDQGMRGRGAVRPPTRGGGVHGNAGPAGHIDSHQKPSFPRQGPARTRKTLSAQQPASYQCAGRHQGRWLVRFAQ